MNKTETITTPMAKVYYEDGILYTEFIPKNPTMEDAQIHTDMVNEHFSDYELVLSLVDSSKSGHNMNKAVRDYMAESTIPTMRAVAVLTASGAARIAGNLFLQFFKPKYQIKMFTEREKAMAWLTEHR